MKAPLNGEEQRIVDALRAGKLTFHDLCCELNITPRKSLEFQMALSRLRKLGRIDVDREDYFIK